ncbi:MAG: hypothetical protein HQ538_05820, partial [Parcubacteria group bacterium]|nr:hypothetical protein [Parcubacteria group bacterium]
IEEAESYASSINIVNPGQTAEMERTVTSIREEFEKVKVPNKEEFINFHKKVLGASMKLEGLIGSLGDSKSSGSESFYSLANLLPKFSGLNDIIFDDIYPEAKRLAAENGVELPKRDFLERYK